MKILVVCQANYCRSPVAEYIFKHFINSSQVYSYGVVPFFSGSMDPRSQEYLKLKNIKYSIHNPKLIKKKFINEADIVFAIDLIVFQKLKKDFYKYRNKIQLLSSVKDGLIINDPFKLKSNESYFKVMDEIYEVCEIWSKKLALLSKQGI